MRGRNGIFRVTVLGLAVVLFVSGCESFFTNSAFSGLQRDPANMSAAELEIFAADALASGDRVTIKKTFDALLKAAGDDPTQAQVSTLVELGVAATGLPQLMTAVIAADGDFSGLDAEALLSGFDSATARSTAEIALAADPGTLTGQQYAYAALGLVGAIGAEAESFEDIDKAAGIDAAQDLLALSLAAYEAEGKEDSDTYELLLELQRQITE